MSSGLLIGEKKFDSLMRVSPLIFFFFFFPLAKITIIKQKLPFKKKFKQKLGDGDKIYKRYKITCTKSYPERFSFQRNFHPLWFCSFCGVILLYHFLSLSFCCMWCFICSFLSLIKCLRYFHPFDLLHPCPVTVVL